MVAELETELSCGLSVFNSSVKKINAAGFQNGNELVCNHCVPVPDSTYAVVRAKGTVL